MKTSIKTLLFFMMAFIMIALAIPLALIVNKQTAEINLLHHEKIGVTVISQLQTINILLAQHRGTINCILNGSQETLPTLKELHQKLTASFNAALKSYDNQHINSDKLKLIYGNWQNLAQNYQTLSVKNSFEQHKNLIADMMELQSDIADETNLSLDNQLYSYYLMNNIVKTIPNLMENMGQVRGFGSGLVAKRYVNETERIELTELSHSVRLAMRTFSFDLKKLFLISPIFEKDIKEKLEQSKKTIESVLLLTEKTIINPSNIALSDKLFFDQYSNAINEIEQLYHKIETKLETELDSRIKTLVIERCIILMSFLILMLIMFIFIIYIIRRINKPLQHAVLCFEKISNEQYDYPIIITHQDEIGQLLKALKIMRNRLADNIEQLKNIVNRLTQAQEIAKLGDCNWHIDENYWSCSESIYHIIESTTPLNYERFLSYITTDDCKKVQAIMQQALQVAGYYSIEYQLITEKGVKKTIFQSIVSTENTDHKVTRLISTLQDVTAQREMESKIRLAAEVFQNVGEGIMVTDKRNNILLVNKAFTDITGFTANEVIGKNPKILSSNKQEPVFYQQVWQQLEVKGIWRGEIWNRRKDNTVYPESLTITVIRDNNGDITNYIGIFSDITEQKKAHEQITYLAHHDSLTGLINRLTLKSCMEDALFIAKKHNRKIAVFFIDLDGFKGINDYLGHETGDEVLKITAERLTQNVRENDIVARLGGDEFIVLLTNIKAKSQISPIAEKLLTQLTQNFNYHEKVLLVTPSIGISIYPDNGSNYEQLLVNADKAMYKAKSQGRNQYAFYV